MANFVESLTSHLSLPTFYVLLLIVGASGGGTSAPTTTRVGDSVGDIVQFSLHMIHIHGIGHSFSFWFRRLCGSSR